MDPQQTADEVRAHWLGMTEALLTALPLGLAPSLLRVYLEQEYDLVLQLKEARLLTAILQNEIAYELDGFFDDDILERIARQVDRPVRDVIEALAPGQWLESMGAALRKDLTARRVKSRLWRFIGQVKSSDDPPEVLADRILFSAARTLAGRVTPRGWPLETRRLQYLSAVDEVRKSVSYAIVAAGFQLVTLEDDGFVIEVEQSDTTDGDLELIGQVVDSGAKKILGELTPACRVVVVQCW